MIAPGRRLMLLRHAKSDWGDPNLADIERPLAPRGRRAAAVLGAYLRDHALIPDLIVTSPSARTRETIELLDLGPVPVETDREVYGGGEHGLLERLRIVPDEVRNLMLVGHNPGIGRLAALLVDGEGRESGGQLPDRGVDRRGACIRHLGRADLELLPRARLCHPEVTDPSRP